MVKFSRLRMRKLTLEEIDERNSKVLIPGWLIHGGEGDVGELKRIFITRLDGSEVSLANAVYADIEWLHESQKRAADRAAQGLLNLRKAAAEALSEEDFLQVFGRTH
jgi:hypothetical protein